MFSTVWLESEVILKITNFVPSRSSLQIYSDSGTLRVAARKVLFGEFDIHILLTSPAKAEVDATHKKRKNVFMFLTFEYERYHSRHTHANRES
jgi:hypothetical protein